MGIIKRDQNESKQIESDGIRESWLEGRKKGVYNKVRGKVTTYRPAATFLTSSSSSFSYAFLLRSPFALRLLLQLEKKRDGLVLAEKSYKRPTRRFSIQTSLCIASRASYPRFHSPLCFFICNHNKKENDKYLPVSSI